VGDEDMVTDWEEWKRLQHSMALEGWEVSDSRLLEVAREYESQGVSSLGEKIASVAAESGRPLAEVAREVLEDFRKQVLK
jgi:hypothetical protein